jgi:hypothetical protein
MRLTVRKATPGMGLEHVTVHSNGRAVPFYQRNGFQHDQRWLRWVP